MTQPSHRPPRRAWTRPMAARNTRESHRVATPLELFFDLCFVVAVASVSDRLHHAVVHGWGGGVSGSNDHIGEGVVAYAMVFFAIWWAWMNFTWFASAYDTDDIAYRLTTFVQIAGVLVLASGVPRAFDNKDFSIVFAGYLLMRVGLVIQWLRVARGDPGAPADRDPVRHRHKRLHGGVGAAPSSTGRVAAAGFRSDGRGRTRRAGLGRAG